MLSRKIRLEVRRHSEKSPWTYAMLDARQREIAARARAGGPGAILLSEVAPVITHGRRTAPSDLLLPKEALSKRGIALCSVDRGGFATYHGPGQWVLFVVERLEVLTGDSRGVRKAVSGLLESVRQTALRYTPSAEVKSGPETGVWTTRGKCAALGIQIEQGVLLHGVAVNAFRTETSFQGLRPCGLDAPVDFLLESRNLGEAIRDAEFDALGKELVLAICREFALEIPDLEQSGSKDRLNCLDISQFHAQVKIDGPQESRYS